MSESMVVENASTEKSTNDLKTEGLNNQMSTKNVANDSKAQTVTNDSKKDEDATPGKRRAKRHEVSDSSLVLETPPGIDSNRRQTRSQTRGTPAVASPPPTKKMALDKNASNGSVNKGRRGRPPKSTASSSDTDEKMDQSVTKQEETEKKKVEKEVKKDEKNEQKDKIDSSVVPPTTTTSTTVAKSDDSNSVEKKEEKVKDANENDVNKSASVEEKKPETEKVSITKSANPGTTTNAAVPSVPVVAVASVPAVAPVVASAPGSTPEKTTVVAESKKEETPTKISPVISSVVTNSTAMKATEVVNNHEK